MLNRLFCFIFFALGLFAQQQQLHEIESRLQGLTGKDRLPLLLQIDSLPSTQPGEKYISIGQEVAEIAKADNNTALFIQGKQIEAKGHIGLGNHEKAMELYFESRELAIKTNDKKGEAKANSEIGNILYFAYNSFVKAIEYYRKAEDIYSRLGDSYGVAKHQNNCADIYAKIGHYVEAVELYTKALKVLENQKDQFLSAETVVLGNIAKACAFLGNMETAWQYNKRMKSIVDRLNEPKRYLQWLHNKGTLSEQNKRYDEAIAIIHEARALQLPLLANESDLAMSRYELSCLNQLARISLKKGDIPKTREYLKKAEENYKWNLDQFTYANFMITKARLYWEEGDFQKAIDLATENAKRCSSHQFLLELKETLKDLALWSRKTNDTASALTYSQDLIDLDQEALKPKLSADIMAILLRYEQNRFDRAFEKSKKLQYQAWILTFFIALFTISLTMLYMRRIKKRNIEKMRQIESEHSEEIRAILDWLSDLKEKKNVLITEHDESENLVKRLIMKMEDEYLYRESTLTLDDLADLLGTNRGTLSHAVNACWGNNISDFINFFRIKEAKSLLLEKSSNRSIITIAFEVGFNSMANFNRVFKEKTGLTPKQYRLVKEHISK